MRARSLVSIAIVLLILWKDSHQNSHGMIKEKTYFWAITLDSHGATETWDGTSYEGSELSHTLTINQALFGPTGYGDSWVDMEAMGYDGKLITAFIIGGDQNSELSAPLQITLSDQNVTFRLSYGDGPVTLTGTHTTRISTV